MVMTTLKYDQTRKKALESKSVFIALQRSRVRDRMVCSYLKENSVIESQYVMTNVIFCALWLKEVPFDFCDRYEQAL